MAKRGFGLHRAVTDHRDKCTHQAGNFVFRRAGVRLPSPLVEVLRCTRRRLLR